MTDLKHFDDLTAIDCPVGELDTDTLGRLMRAWVDGGRLELFWGDGVWDRLLSQPIWDAHAAYRLAPKLLTKPSVDWTAVGPMWNWMATDQSGLTLMSEGMPRQAKRWWEYDGDQIPASYYTSFVPGTCDWKDSLVMRPGYEGE